MKILILALSLFLMATSALADNVLTWVNESPTADVSIEKLGLNGFVIIASVGPGVAIYLDVDATDGCYRVRAFTDDGFGTDIFSAYSNTACKLEAPSNLTIQ